MTDIYDADGHLDRAKVMDTLSEVLTGHEAAAKVLGPASARAALQRRLVDLLDECSEGFTFDPIESPGMYSDMVNTCRPVWSSTPPKTHGR